MRNAPPDAAATRAVHFGEQVGEQGIAADDLKWQGQFGDGGAAAVEQQVKERQQKDAQAAAPEHGGGGVDELDERGINLQRAGGQQAGSTPQRQQAGGASAPLRPDEPAADAAHERERAEGKRSKNPAVGCAVLPGALQEVVYVDGEVVIRQEEAARLPMIRHKAQQRPIAGQAERAGNQLPAQAAEHEHQRRHEVAFGDGLQGIAEEAHVLRPGRCQIPLHQHTQLKEQHHAAQHAPAGAEAPVRASFSRYPAKAKGMLAPVMKMNSGMTRSQQMNAPPHSACRNCCTSQAGAASPHPQAIKRCSTAAPPQSSSISSPRRASMLIMRAFMAMKKINWCFPSDSQEADSSPFFSCSTGVCACYITVCPRLSMHFWRDAGQTHFDVGISY